MPSLDEWQALGIIFGSIGAVLLVAGWAARGLRRMWRLMSKANRWLDQVLGEPARDGLPARPSLMQRVERIEDRFGSIEEKLADHLEWHGDSGGVPARRPSPQPNGGQARPSPVERGKRR